MATIGTAVQASAVLSAWLLSCCSCLGFWVSSPPRLKLPRKPKPARLLRRKKVPLAVAGLSQREVATTKRPDSRTSLVNRSLTMARAQTKRASAVTPISARGPTGFRTTPPELSRQGCDFRSFFQPPAFSHCVNSSLRSCYEFRLIRDNLAAAVVTAPPPTARRLRLQPFYSIQDPAPRSRRQRSSSARSAARNAVRLHKVNAAMAAQKTIIAAHNRRLPIKDAEWHRILNAVERLQAKAPDDGEAVR